MQLSEKEIATLRLVLKKIDFLEYLKFHELDELIANMEKRPFQRGEVIIKQGEPGETFFILATGSVGVFRKKMLLNRRVAKLEKDSYFGEMALLNNERRNATIVGEEDGELYYLPRETFTKVLLNNPDVAELIRQTAEYRQAQNRAQDINEKSGE